MALLDGVLSSVWTDRLGAYHPLAVKPDPRTILGENIRRRRGLLGFTQESFAHYAQLARTYYGRIEKGKQNVSLERLVWLAAHLEVSVSDLTEGLTAEVCLLWSEGEFKLADG